MSSFIRRLPELSLTRKLILYLALTGVIPLLVLGRVSYDISRSAVHDEAHRYTREIMDEKKRYLVLLMQNVESLTLNLASLEDIKNILTQPIQPGGSAGGDYERLATQAKIGYILNEYANLRELLSIDIFSLVQDGAQHNPVNNRLLADCIYCHFLPNLIQHVSRSPRQSRDRHSSEVGRLQFESATTKRCTESFHQSTAPDAIEQGL